MLPVNLVLWQHEAGFQKWRRCRKGASFYWSPRPTRKPIRDRTIWWYLFKCSAPYRHCMMTDNWCFWERAQGLRQAKPFDSKDGHGQKQEKKTKPLSFSQCSISLRDWHLLWPGDDPWEIISLQSSTSNWSEKQLSFGLNSLRCIKLLWCGWLIRYVPYHK